MTLFHLNKNCFSSAVFPPCGCKSLCPFAPLPNQIFCTVSQLIARCSPPYAMRSLPMIVFLAWSSSIHIAPYKLPTDGLIRSLRLTCRSGTKETHRHLAPNACLSSAGRTEPISLHCAFRRMMCMCRCTCMWGTMMT